MMPWRAQAARLARAERARAVLTISFVRSPAIPAAECSGDPAREPADSGGVRGAAAQAGTARRRSSATTSRAARGSSSASTRPRSARPAAARACASTSTPADGLADAMRLSQAMTVKMAVADCRARRRQGGARGAGAADRRGAPRAAAPLRRSSSPSLGGTYRTAGDMNITPADLDVVAETLPVGVRHDRRGRQQRPRHGARRAARDPRERRARVRLARPRGPHACSCRASARSGTTSRATCSRTRARACSSPTSTRRARAATGASRRAGRRRARRPSATSTRRAPSAAR